MSHVSPEYQREWRAKNREHTRAYMREYLKRWAAANPEKVKGYRQSDKYRENRKVRYERRRAENPNAPRIADPRKRLLTEARALLYAATGVSRSQIPQQLIAAKAAYLTAQRELRSARLGIDDDGLLGEINAFCRKHRIAENTFGRRAAGDGGLIRDLRGDRRGKPRKLGRMIEEKVRAFMDTFGANLPGDE